MNLMLAEAYPHENRMMEPDEIINHLANIGHVCYKSEKKLADFESLSQFNEANRKFVKNLVSSGHHSVLEHYSFTVTFVVDRGVSHELVRHRLASYSQESTRYCNYSAGKYGSECTFIIPNWCDAIPEGSFCEIGDFTDLPGEQFVWLKAMHQAEVNYVRLIKEGWKPQQARSVLPNSLKTEVVMTANLREWRHFFQVRAAGTTGTPHPQMLEVTIPLLAKVKKLVPVVFEDIVIGGN